MMAPIFSFLLSLVILIFSVFSPSNPSPSLLIHNRSSKHIATLSYSSYESENNKDPDISEIYECLNNFQVTEIMLGNADYRGYPASVINSTGFDQISSLGVEAIPHILAYAKELVIDLEFFYDGKNDTYEERELASKGFFFLACSYEMLNAPYMYEWFHPNEDDYHKLVHPLPWINALESYIADNGLRLIFPFISAEEATVQQDKISRRLEDLMFTFGWSLIRDFDGYQYNAALITDFGKYAVPYILDYILSHEGQPLTSDEEMHLGILLHLSYRMLGVETTADWHMPAEPVASTTDPFPYTHELIEHLGEYGLEAAS